MSRYVTGCDPVAAELCEALGLGQLQVSSLVLRLRPNQVIEARVTTAVYAEQLQEIVTATKRHRLMVEGGTRCCSHNCNQGWACPLRQAPALSDEAIDQHLDAILRSAGSRLKNYTMAKSLDDMRAAMRRVLAAVAGVPDTKGDGNAG
jgi:hypothetical protein